MLQYSLMKTLSLKESQVLYNVLDENQLVQEPVLIQRDGRPIGVVVSMAEYEAFRAWRELEQGRRQPSPGDEAFRREVEAFERMKPALLQQYAGRVVAIHNGAVIEVGDENESVTDVASRVYQRIGYVPVYIQRVEAAPHVYRISGPRIAHQ